MLKTQRSIKIRPSPAQWAIILICLLALIVRFRYLGEIEHNIDHAYPLWQAMTTLDTGLLPLAGQGTSVLFANPPLTGYLFIPAVLLTRSPLGVYVFVIALNTLAVWMAYRAVRVLLGTAAGLLAAALMAVNPWVIEYSRTSWVQCLMTFFVCAVAWLLWPVLLGKARRPGRRVALALIVAALFTQTYLLAFFIVAPLTVLLLIFRQRIPWKAAAVGVGVFALLTGLYTVGLLNQSGTVRQRVDDFSTAESRLTLEAWESAVRLVSGAEYAAARGLDAPVDDAQRRYDLSQFAHYVLTAAVLAGIGAACYAIYRRDDRRDVAIILLVWFGLPVLAMSYTGNPVHPFYQMLTLPAGYGLAAWGVLTVLRPVPERARLALLVGAFVPFAVLMLLNSARYYQETDAIPGVHRFGALPVDYGLRLGDAIRAARDAGQVVYADEEAWILNSFAGQRFGVIRDTRAPAFVALPANGSVYISFEAVMPPPGDLINTLNLPDSTIYLYDLTQTVAPGERLDVPSVQGLRLAGYTLTAETPETWLLETTWQVDHIDQEVYSRIYAPFVHLLDANGERVLNLGGEGLRGDAWRIGWHYRYRIPITPPDDAAGPFRVLVGQYDGLNDANIVFTPTDGEPTVAVELPQTLP